MSGDKAGSARKRICIVTPDIMGPIRNGGVGTSCANLAFLLASSDPDAEVEILFASLAKGDHPKDWAKWVRFYRKRGIQLRRLQEPDVEVRAHYWAMISYLVYQEIKKTPYDLLIFPDMFGVAYYTVLAKKLGLGLTSTSILTKFLGPQVWSRKGNGDCFRGPHEIFIPMFERLGVEMSDHIQFATPWSREWCDERGWRYPAHTECLFPFEVPPDVPAKRSASEADELVFFGRLEERKGLGVFLSAVEKLLESNQFSFQQLTFLGREGSPDVARQLRLFEARWGHIVGVNIRTQMQSDEAISYLSQKKCMAVVLSRTETMGFTLLECLVHAIPVVASRIEPFEKIVGDRDSSLLVDPLDVAAVADAIRERRAVMCPERAREIWRETNERWLALIARLLREPSSAPRVDVSEPTISVLIVHCQRPHLLAEALESLAGGTRMPDEVLIYDNGSRDSDLDSVLERYRRVFTNTGVRFECVFGSENRGPSYGRNVLAERATSTFLLFMDDDNRAFREEIEILKRAQSVSEADVISVPLQKFVDGQEDLWKKRVWLPLGFDRAVSIFENGLGDTNSLIKRSLFLKVGGFIDRPEYKAEDFHLLSALVAAGAKAYVCPEPLVHYRVHTLNRSHSRDKGERAFHAAFALDNGEKNPARSLVVVGEMMVGLAESVGSVWSRDPILWPRPISAREYRNKLTFDEWIPDCLVGPGIRIARFGLGYCVESQSGASSIEFWIEFPLLWMMSGRSLSDGSLRFSIVVENGIEMTCANPYFYLEIPPGISSVQVPLTKEMTWSSFRLRFVGAKRVFLRDFAFIPFDVTT